MEQHLLQTNIPVVYGTPLSFTVEPDATYSVGSVTYTYGTTTITLTAVAGVYTIPGNLFTMNGHITVTTGATVEFVVIGRPETPQAVYTITSTTHTGGVPSINAPIGEDLIFTALQTDATYTLVSLTQNDGIATTAVPVFAGIYTIPSLTSSLTITATYAANDYIVTHTAPHTTIMIDGTTPASTNIPVVYGTPLSFTVEPDATYSVVA